MSSHEALIGSFLTPISSPTHMRDWVFSYFGIDLPLGRVDPESNSSPAEWLFEAYEALRKNTGGETPGYIVFAPREGYKTLTTAMLEVLCAVHFMLPVAHMSAIESQSKKTVQYISSFLKKVQPYLVAHGIELKSSNTRHTEMQDANGQVAYISIIICTMSGSNSEHTTLFVVDEVDVVRFPNAYEEAKLIPGVMKGVLPITVLCSTRKFSFGLVQKEIDNAELSGFKILHWNILDVAERCPAKRHQPAKPKVKRYIVKQSLPLRNIGEEEYLALTAEQRGAYSSITAFSGCAKCPLLPVCRTRLAKRSPEDYGGLYKPLDFIISLFRKVSPDMAEAQLMCWKPSSKGLVYPKFSEEEEGNVYSVGQAWTSLTGELPPQDITFSKLVAEMHRRGIKFSAGVDWGYRHAFAIVISAEMHNGEWWLVDAVAIPGLELEEMVKISKEMRDKYRIKRWFADTAQPSNMKTFRKHGMPCTSFKKDIDAGIEAVRGRVVDAYNTRRLKVILSDVGTEANGNAFLISGFRCHHFKLDSAGNPTREPDDEEYADVMDALRYLAQNLFKPTAGMVSANPHTPLPVDVSTNNSVYSTWLGQKVGELTRGDTSGSKGRSSSGAVFFDFSNPTREDD